MDTSRKEDPIPPTSIIAVPTEITTIIIALIRGAVISIIIMETDLSLISFTLTIITCNPPQDLMLAREE